MLVPQWVIERKRDGHSLSRAELTHFVLAFACGEIPDHQMAALAMAIYFQGMTDEETTILTDIMLHSGDVLDPAAIPLPTVDKHSTGGIGDKVSLVLAPLVACCGVAVPMIAGRGLGITGGTIDKLESIPGYSTRLTNLEFQNVLNRCGCSIIGQTDRLAPADRKLYALRDVTGTVPSIPLITASILSKKLAEGIRALVLDVKCGCGAFMQSPARAHALAESLVRVSGKMGKPTSALITNMNQPLGHAVGNALEVAEAICTLKGNGPCDVRDLALALGTQMLLLGGVEHKEDDAHRRLEAALASGQGLEKFKQMVSLHHGDLAVFENPTRLPVSACRAPLPAPRSGYVVKVDAERIGQASLLLGAGRTQAHDAIDPGAGIGALVKVGTGVERGQPLAVLYAAQPARLESAREKAASAFEVADQLIPRPPLILNHICSETRQGNYA